MWFPTPTAEKELVGMGFSDEAFSMTGTGLTFIAAFSEQTQVERVQVSHVTFSMQGSAECLPNDANATSRISMTLEAHGEKGGISYR